MRESLLLNFSRRHNALTVLRLVPQGVAPGGMATVSETVSKRASQSQFARTVCLVFHLRFFEASPVRMIMLPWCHVSGRITSSRNYFYTQLKK